MKKILGLDLGVSSVGWALIGENEGNKEIIQMGVRVIPLSKEDSDEFTKGNAISKNQSRTVKRGQRRGTDRYQLRRTNLRNKLANLNMLPGSELFELTSLELYGLRDKAVKEQITLHELGRLFFHLNQRRGYKSIRKEEAADGKETDYVQEVNGRHHRINEMGLTVGQYFYNQLLKNKHFRVKQEVFPRVAYMDEFDAIWAQQFKYYPEVLTEDNLEEIRDRIIYYQRPLKSQKGLVSICELEGKWYTNKEGVKRFGGPRVAPKSSPVFQLGKIWESINSITIKDRYGVKQPLSLEQKQALFEYLDNNEKLTETNLFKIIGLKKRDGYTADKLAGTKGIQGNLTKTQLAKVLEDWPGAESLLEMNLLWEERQITDFTTGEMRIVKTLSADIEKSPLYQLWHLLYATKDEGELIKTLQSRYSFPNELCKELSKLDFTKAGFGNKSVRAIRNIMPFLVEGSTYSKSCEFAGYNHSSSLNKEQNATRPLLEKLPNLPKNSLRQPIVEKILNQMINVVNAITEKHGRPDVIVVELARELKQSREERNDTYAYINKRTRENEKIARHLEDFGIKVSRRNIEKYRLFEQVSNDESKVQATCLYCAQPFSFTAAMNGEEVEVEHIIPRSRLFDDSFTNKTLVHTRCNSDKGNQTAFDFMKAKSASDLETYIDQVQSLFERKIISRSKKDKLLMPADKIPQDFIMRQLRETQYISREALALLQQISRDVYATSGAITAYLRHQWGWDDVLMNLQIEKYRNAGLTEWIETDAGKKERIIGWTKRDDHRHHAIDALTVACTSRSIVQRINTLNQILEDKPDANGQFSRLEGFAPLKEFIAKNKPFTTKMVEEKTAPILVSFKPGKRVATKGRRIVKKGGKRIIAQEGIIVPRGALNEESIYGKIKVLEKHVPTKKLFEQPDAILKRRIRKMVKERLTEHGGDVKKAQASLKKNPLYQSVEKGIELTHATVFKEEFVIRYPLGINFNKVEKIVDPEVKQIVQQRLSEFDNDPKKAFKDLPVNPLYLNREKGITIQSVRCFTGLGKLQPLHKTVNGVTGKHYDNHAAKDVDFVKPGNNHHLSLFRDENGKLCDIMTSFWEAVDRVRQGLPIINKVHPDGHAFIESFSQNEMFVFQPDSLSEMLPVSDLIYRVQKMSKKSNGQVDIWFRYHLATQVDDSNDAKETKQFINIQNLNALLQFKKVAINILGEII